MPDGLLDRQSLLYQFSIKPPEPLGGKLWVSDGKTNKVFAYSLGGTETVSLATFGNVRALIIDLTGEGETIRLWLVPDMHYLPIKARFSSKDGKVSEQRVMSLDFSLQ